MNDSSVPAGTTRGRQSQTVARSHCYCCLFYNVKRWESNLDLSQSSGALIQQSCGESDAEQLRRRWRAKHLAQSLDYTQRTSTLRDSLRANFSVGEGHSLSTPLNILVSDWKETKQDGTDVQFCSFWPILVRYTTQKKQKLWGHSKN